MTAEFLVGAVRLRRSAGTRIGAHDVGLHAQSMEHDTVIVDSAVKGANAERL